MSPTNEGTSRHESCEIQRSDDDQKRPDGIHQGFQKVSASARSATSIGLTNHLPTDSMDVDLSDFEAANSTNSSISRSSSSCDGEPTPRCDQPYYRHHHRDYCRNSPKSMTQKRRTSNAGREQSIIAAAKRGWENNMLEPCCTHDQLQFWYRIWCPSHTIYPSERFTVLRAFRNAANLAELKARVLENRSRKKAEAAKILQGMAKVDFVNQDDDTTEKNSEQIPTLTEMFIDKIDTLKRKTAVYDPEGQMGLDRASRRQRTSI